MRALRLPAWKTEPELVEVDQPTPGPGQVVVRIGAAGACHSDLHLMHDFEAGGLPWNPPFTLGHENAGWVHRLGAGVTGLEVGQPVAVYGPWGCGRCARCRVGVDNYCENPAARRCRAVVVASAWTAGWPSTSWCRTPGTCCRCRTGSIRSTPRH